MSDSRRTGSFFWNGDTDSLRFGRIAVLGLSGLLLVWLLFAGTVLVGTGQIAVMTRFGRVTGQELGEGFHIKNPLDHPNKYDVKVQREDAKAESASKDLQDVRATLVLNYTLERGKVSEIHQKVGTEFASKLIDPAIQEVFKATTAKFDATQLITDRVDVKKQATELLRTRLSPHGIVVAGEGLSITNFSFSPEFTQAIEAKQVAQQHAQRARFNLEASTIDAQAQKVQGAALTALFLQKQFLEKWDGHLPNVLSGDSLSFLLDLQKQAAQP